MNKEQIQEYLSLCDDMEEHQKNDYTEYLNLCDDWLTLQQNEHIENLFLSNELQNMMQSCDHKPIFDMNIVDFFNPKEPVTSKIIEQIFAYHNHHEYIILKSFCETFLKPCGFDCRLISKPIIEAEKNGHIDIKIKEEGKYAIIIENKLKGADFQRNQLARYIQTMIDEGFEEGQIFIIILPQYSNIIIHRSTWNLPPDYNTANNSSRRCGCTDNTLCWCDIPNKEFTEKEVCHCKGCIRWENEFSQRTKILHQDFSKWMILVEEIIPRREQNVRSALLQFADYLNGLYNTRINQKLNMKITKFLREKLDIETTLSAWKKLNNRIEEVEELKSGLETLRTEMASDFIDLWHEKLLGKWPMLKNEPRKFFGILIKGMWFGCWWAEESDNGDSPIWGIWCSEGMPTPHQIKVAEKIISKCGFTNKIVERKDGWMTWSDTMSGDDVADKLYTAANELGYLKDNNLV